MFQYKDFPIPERSYESFHMNNDGLGHKNGMNTPKNLSMN